MPCGCANKSINNEKSDNNTNNKLLSLETISSTSIDDIITMYRQGYILEETSKNNVGLKDTVLTMSNSHVTTSVSGNNVTIRVTIGSGETLDWWIRVTSKYDYGYGKGQGVGDYPWIVEIIDGTTQTYLATKTYKPGLYVAELNIMGIGPVDFSTFELGGAVTGLDISVVTVGFDNLTKPYMRTIGVSGTGTGSFSIKEGTTSIASGTMTNGWGMIDIDGISVGTHTFCATPSTTSACRTFTVDNPLPYNRWSCSDKCTTAKQIGEYSDQATCKAECIIITPPTHAFVIGLSSLSWADIGGLTAYLPSVTTAFADAITLYGWLGWEVDRSTIENGNLVIYLRDTSIVSSGSTMNNYRIGALVLPALAEIGAALAAIAAIALRFGFLIIGYYIVNLLTKAVEVTKTQADTEQIRTQTVSDLCKSGALTAAQCVEATKPPAPKGICETFGFSSVVCSQAETGILLLGGLFVAYVGYNALKKVTPKSSTPSSSTPSPEKSK